MALRHSTIALAAHVVLAYTTDSCCAPVWLPLTSVTRTLLRASRCPSLTNRPPHHARLVEPGPVSTVPFGAGTTLSVGGTSAW